MELVAGGLISSYLNFVGWVQQHEIQHSGTFGLYVQSFTIKSNDRSYLRSIY